MMSLELCYVPPTDSRGHGQPPPQTALPPWSTTGGLQPILPLILRHALLQLILWGHEVTCPQADVVQDGTCCYGLK